MSVPRDTRALLVPVLSSSVPWVDTAPVQVTALRALQVSSVPLVQVLLLLAQLANIVPRQPQLLHAKNNTTARQDPQHKSSVQRATTARAIPYLHQPPVRWVTTVEAQAGQHNLRVS